MMRYFTAVFFCFFALTFFSSGSYALERSVPENLRLENISKIYGTTVPSTFELYAFAPDMLAGWNTPLYEREVKYVLEKYKKLPILGGWYGNGNFPNKETLASVKINASFSIGAPRLSNDKMHDFMTEINIPFVSLKADSMKDYAALYTELGNILNVPVRGKELAEYVIKSVDTANNITKNVKKKKRVYVALNDNGLTTQCPADKESDLLYIAGGENVHKCMSGQIREQVSIEQVFAYDPDVILIDRPSFYKLIKTDKKWAKLPAVKRGDIILVPNEPFSWLEKQTVMRFLAIQYIAARLYPEYSDLDLAAEVKKYLKLFLDYDMTDKEAAAFVKPEKSIK